MELYARNMLFLTIALEQQEKMGIQGNYPDNIHF